ncbi:ubiquinol-cytochrome c reductase cytochrome b subunit [Streptomyces abyssalis]|uniref:Cytochrome bc1 complex cytochrome b subunit n=1 Tax=Streptomyces abyssalis TaxID=933944 RepID=A0A1E7JJP9_9ACTN|nr:cytochrome bc complex cytochrome b subunit [Streptomyces abyssalis]OEU87332.1 ubiquinol-cytochrome c reductase cytochrome b subunit [Streptomyces abyssalis]OEU87863.1 ubiquinol-cytochrome c reductase cytochrome b subunit [Streptomyces abyssalis]
MLPQRRRVQPGVRTGRAAKGAFTYLDARLPAAESGSFARKVFPDHWSFLLGELALYSLVLLILTGVFLTFFFHPGELEIRYTGSYGPMRGQLVSEAYDSTLRISFDVRGGLLIRQVHHWAALVFVTAIGVHMMRVFFTGAFRKPREINWVVGVTLFVLAVAEGFCGYSLPDDLLSGTGLRVVQSLLLSIPVIGTYLSLFLFGGEYPGTEIIPRLYTVHILLIPALIVALVVVHLILVVYLKHTQWGGPGRTEKNVVGQPMFPQFAAKSTGLQLMVFGLITVLGGVAQINPVWNYGPYRTDQVSTGSQPDWYVGFLEGSLRLMPPFETTVWGHTFMWNILVPTVILPGLLFTGIYLYPFLERWLTGDEREHHLCDRPRERPARTAMGVAGITFYAVLLLAGGNDVIATLFQVSLNGLTWIFRVALVLAPVVAFMVTRRLCVALRAHELGRLREGDETGEVRQSIEGGMEPGHRPVPAGERYTLLMRETPRPLEPAPEAGADGHRARRVRRLRTALSRWYFSDRVG